MISTLMTLEFFSHDIYIHDISVSDVTTDVINVDSMLNTLMSCLKNTDVIDVDVMSEKH